MRCSTVPTRAEGMLGSASTVQSRVSITLSKRAWIDAVQVGAAENDAVIGSGWADGQVDPSAGVDTDADAVDRGLQRPLAPAEAEASVCNRQSGKAIHQIASRPAQAESLMPIMLVSPFRSPAPSQ